MNAREALAELRSAGTAQNRKVYARHGVDGPMFGVSYAVQGKLARRIGTDHALARSLWASGNHDARVLAAAVADPEQLDSKTATAWAKDLTNYVLTDALSGPVARSSIARRRAETWRRSRSEWVATLGWNVTAHLVARPDAFTASELDGLLAEIEAGIHRAPNRARYSMNTVLISIGTYHPRLRARAVAAAKRIGPVEVDHGETGCKTPDAASYIAKAGAHFDAKSRKAKTGKGPGTPRRATGSAAPRAPARKA